MKVTVAVVLITASITWNVKGQSPTVWNVADHTGPSLDVTDALQEGLSQQWKTGQPVYVPARQQPWEVSQTLVTPYRTGGALHGAFPGAPVQRFGHPSLDGAGSRLQWRGTPGETLLQITGSHFSLANLALFGRDSNTDASPSGTGLLFTRPSGSKGIGSGKHEIGSIVLRGFETGIQIGRSSGEMNNDMVQWRRLEIHDCDVAVRMVNQMAMSWRMDSVMLATTPIGFLIEAGGLLDLGHVFCNGPTRLLVFPKESIGPGPNNATYSIGLLKVDAQANGEFVLVDQQQSSTINVSIQAGRVSGRKETRNLATLRSNSTLTLGDFHASAGAVVHLHDQARLILLGSTTGIREVRH